MVKLQCVVLSSDKFSAEFHVGWICEKFQDAGVSDGSTVDYGGMVDR